MLQLVGLLLQRRQTLHSTDHTLGIHSGINNLLSDNLNYLEKFHQSLIFGAAENCRFFGATKKGVIFQDDISSISIDNFKDHYVLVFDLTELQNATENCHYPELVGEPLKLEMNFTAPLEHVTELIVWRKGMCSVAVDMIGAVGKNVWKGWCFSPAKCQPYLTTQVSVRWFFSFWLCCNSS